MAITTIQSGSPLWDVPINANFAELDARITGGAQVVQIDNPFTFLNGASSTWNTPYIRYVQLDGYKLIMLNVDQMTITFTNNYEIVVMLVPQSYAPNTQINIDLGIDNSLQVGSDGKCYLYFKNGGDTPFTKANVSAVYIRKDD